MSVVCHARIHSASDSPPPVYLPSSCIVKLYDRRHCKNYRKEYDEGRPYSAAKEYAYQQFLLNSGKQAEAEHDESITSLCEEGDEAGIEAYIENACRRLHTVEVRAYEELHELQGTLIPIFYGSLRYSSPFFPSSSGSSGPSSHSYTAEGILIEYIPSTPLGKYLRSAIYADPPPYHDIAQVCDSAMQLMDQIDDFSLINDDVRLDNILVAPVGSVPMTPDGPPHSPSDSAPHRFRCVGIDFACTRLRFPDETDEQWRRAKQNKDEQGAVGHVVNHLLRLWTEEKEEEKKTKGGNELNSPLPSGQLWQYPPKDREHRR